MIEVLKYTEDPLGVMSIVASSCWDSKPNKKIAIDCLEANHGRVFEYVDMIVVLTDYSARMIRELYTHTVGVTKLQSSTRYVNYENFKFYTPPSLKGNKKYKDAMSNLSSIYSSLLEDGYKKEDLGNLLPLGMTTKVVVKINLRALLHMFELRTCNRTYIEFRTFMKDLKKTISNLNTDWKYIMDNYAVTKCDKTNYCDERKSCGKHPPKVSSIIYKGQNDIKC